MNTKQKHLHVIGIGGIGVSALARYYKHLGYTVSGSDGADSPLLDTLRSEGFDVSIGHLTENLPEKTDLVIYSEAIITKPDLAPEEQIYANPELAKARLLEIPHLSYPKALAEVFDAKQGVAVAGSHGKSTTTALVSLMLAGNLEEFPVDSGPGVTAIIGTQVSQLGGTNFYTESGAENFVIEACEYKRSFLSYHPYITVITNIDLDHLDYYSDLDDYLSAFQSLVDQTRGYVIISDDDENSHRLHIAPEKKIVVGNGYIQYGAPTEEQTDQGISRSIESKQLPLPCMTLQVPGEHILQDAYLAYTVGRLLGMEESTIVPKLEGYAGAWRRSEIIKTTEHGNILISDYGHHPSEIRPTLRAIRGKYPDKKLVVVFQPHQYSRTRELLADFATTFDQVDELIIPDIYFSRDKEADVEYMTVDRLIDTIRPYQPNIHHGHGLEETAQWISRYDQEHPNTSVLLLLGAGDVDSLRYRIV